MTRAQALLTAAIVTTALTVAGCADDRTRSSGSAASTAAPAATTASAPAGPTSQPVDATAATTPTPPTRKANPTNRPPDDRTGDLVPGRRTITGTVERTGEWILLRTDDATWALLGRRAEALRAGSTATVTGMTARRPAGCPADGALSVYSAR